MIKKYILMLILTVSFLSTWGQGKLKKTPLFDIPGSFVVDFGFNRAIQGPGGFDQDFWGSRTVNVYFQYPVQIGASKFSFVPALGLSMERFKLSNQYTLSPDISSERTYNLIDAKAAPLSYPNIIKSMIITNYVDIPIGFRFDTRPQDLSRSFSVTMGMRIGVLYQCFTKIKYKENGKDKIVKNQQRYGLNIFRYGAYTRIGIGGFNLFFVYNLSPLFEPDKGPDKTGMNTLTAGISINGL